MTDVQRAERAIWKLEQSDYRVARAFAELTHTTQAEAMLRLFDEFTSQNSSADS